MQLNRKSTDLPERPLWQAHFSFLQVYSRFADRFSDVDRSHRTKQAAFTAGLCSDNHLKVSQRLSPRLRSSQGT